VLDTKKNPHGRRQDQVPIAIGGCVGCGMEDGMWNGRWKWEMEM